MDASSSPDNFWLIFLVYPFRVQDDGFADLGYFFTLTNLELLNLLIFHNLVTLDRALEKLKSDGHIINESAVDDLSPYQTGHLNRFGNYAVNMDRVPEPLNFELS